MDKTTAVRMIMTAILIMYSVFQSDATDIYIKGSIDVARCQASCADEFLSSTTATDSSCKNYPDCNMFPGCRHACSYWDEVKSAGMPIRQTLDVSVDVSDQVALFLWNPPADRESHVVFVLREFNYERMEWIVHCQTLDNSCTLHKQDVNEQSRYQLIAVTQSQVISLTAIKVDLSPSTTPLPVNINSTLPLDPIPVSPYTDVTPHQNKSVVSSILVSTCCMVCVVVVAALVVRRYRNQHTKLKRNSSRRSNHSGSNPDDFTTSSSRIVQGEVVSQGEFGYVVSRGFYKSTPVFVKSLSGSDSPPSVKQELLLEISKFTHIGRLGHFLSVVAVVDEQNLIMLAVERMLEYTTLTNYLRCCYDDGEVIGGTIYTSVLFREAKLRSCLTSTDLISMAEKLALTMDSLYCLGYTHKKLTSDYIIIDPQTKQFKLVDPAMSRSIFTYSALCSSAHFMAPEILKGQEFTSWSDIWSFGMLLWQMVKFGEVPLSEVSETELYTWLCSSSKPEKPDNCSTELYELMSCCWSIYPEQRPSFSSIADVLSSILPSADDHVQLICKSDSKTTFDYIVDMPVTPSTPSTKPVVRNCHSTIDQSPLWITEAVPQTPRNRGSVIRAMLPSYTRLNATSDGNKYCLSDVDESDDNVFDEGPIPSTLNKERVSCEL